MHKKHLSENIRPQPESVVRVKEMGNITELFWSTLPASTGPTIIKMDKDIYFNTVTQEFKYFRHNVNRLSDFKSIRASMSRARDIINTNVTDCACCKWVTLTYAQNMTDPKRLYEDFKSFNRRFRKQVGHYEYITAAEPQKRGAWHLHVIMIFPSKAPYIPNSDVAQAWGHGFTKTKAIKDADNVGAYLSVYLTDMFLEDMAPDHAMHLVNEKHYKIDTRKVEDEHTGEICEKNYVKGSRLYLYPPQFHIFRWSKGIKMPVISKVQEQVALSKVGSAKLTFERTIRLNDESQDFQAVMNYRYFNLKQ